MKVFMLKFKIFLLLFLFCNFNLNAWKICKVCNRTRYTVFIQFFKNDVAGLGKIDSGFWCYIEPGKASEVNQVCPQERETVFDRLVHISGERVLVPNCLWISFFDGKNFPKHFIFCEGMKRIPSQDDSKESYISAATFFCEKGLFVDRHLLEFGDIFLVKSSLLTPELMGAYWEHMDTKVGDLIISEEQDEDQMKIVFRVEWQEKTSGHGRKRSFSLRGNRGRK